MTGAQYEEDAMNHGRTQSRLGSLERGQVATDPAVAFQRLADHLGVSPDALRAEGDAVAEQCRLAGATTLDGCIEFIAADTGISVADLRDEMGRYMSWGRSW